MDTSE
jgi:hypothetical protein